MHVGKRKKSARVADTVREEIRALRETQGLSQRKAAELVGVGQSAWCEYESGKRPISLPTLQKMADGFGVAVKVVFGR